MRCSPPPPRLACRSRRWSSTPPGASRSSGPPASPSTSTERRWDRGSSGETGSLQLGPCSRPSAAGRWPPSTPSTRQRCRAWNRSTPSAGCANGLDLLDEHRPAFELALRWLADRRPPERPTSVVHGDFRVGNLLVDPDHGLRAVLDWELAHLGDPLEDLGWLCVRAWRFGGDGEAGGVGPLDDLLDAYAEATGEPVSADDVHWWIVAGTLTWGLICAVQARRHLDGHVRSVELATIGRRVCETEYDLLDLIGITEPKTSAPEPSPDRGTQPTADRPRPSWCGRSTSTWATSSLPSSTVPPPSSSRSPATPSPSSSASWRRNRPPS
ncbi:MAG: phosphotransferase family protein [Acidimicrobiales bacterium]